MKRLSKPLKRVNNGYNPSSWKISYHRFNPIQEGLREALCTLGNGYFGTRGAVTESPSSSVHYPGTYIAGVYNKLTTQIAGRKILNEDMVNCPNWMFLTFRIGNGEWILPSTNNILTYYQELDMHGGILARKISVVDSMGRKTTIDTQRIVHMRDCHYAAIRYAITPENYEGPIVIRSGLDGSVQNSGVVRYEQLNSKHLKPCSMGTFTKKRDISLHEYQPIKDYDL